MIDPKVIAYSARKIVEVVCSDPATSPELRRVLTELMGADLKTLHHRKLDDLGMLPDFISERNPGGEFDYVTVVDANGRTRHLIFL